MSLALNKIDRIVRELSRVTSRQQHPSAVGYRTYFRIWMSGVELDPERGVIKNLVATVA
jgi:hypothetical protein